MGIRQAVSVTKTVQKDDSCFLNINPIETLHYVEGVHNIGKEPFTAATLLPV